MTESPLIFVIAGEPSGDRMGGEIMRALKQKSPVPLRFMGIGGDFMIQEGLTSLFPLSDLTLMGVVEIIPELPTVLKRYVQTLDALKKMKPDLVLTIDSPDFCLRIARKAKKYGFKTLHYTAPTVWAWRPGRAKKIASYLDHLLLLYPFEKKYFDAVNLPNTYVGHPLCYVDIKGSTASDFRKKYKIPPQKKILCILPGSRQGEIHRLMPLFYEGLKKLRRVHPQVHFVLPVASAVKFLVYRILEEWDFPVTLVEGEEDKYGAMNASTVALATSGTVTLELAMAELPTLLTYKMHPFTAWLGKKLIKIPFIGLPNIISNKKIIPELIQEHCTDEAIFKNLDDLLKDPCRRDQQIKAFKSLKAHLTRDQDSPSEKAAEVILNLLR